jgi:acetoin utilization deacetylase AcuC-like enzyme
VSSEGFGGISQTLVTLAEKLCGGKVVFLLEGGYHLKGLQESALQSLDVLTGQRKQPGPSKPDITLETVLEKSRKTLGSYWKF